MSEDNTWEPTPPTSKHEVRLHNRLVLFELAKLVSTRLCG